MAAMIGRRKRRFGRVFALEHSGRMRDADEKRRVLARFGGGIVQRAAGMLFENIVNVLQARDFALANAIYAFIKPADRRSERDAVVTNFSGGLQFLKRCPERVVVNLFHSDVVQLQKIDMIGSQSLQRRVGCARDCFRRKILRNFALTTAARFAVMHEIVTHLCRNHDFISLFWKSFRDQLLAEAVPVSIGGVEESYAEIEGFVHERDRFALRKISPPASRNRPKTKANFAHRKVGVFISAK